MRAYYAVDFGCACRRLLAMSLLFLALVVGICNGEFSKRISIMQQTGRFSLGVLEKTIPRRSWERTTSASQP